MKCLWVDDSGADERGWRVVKCVRCGKPTKPTPHPHNKIHRPCPAWPFSHEWGEWVSVILEAVLITPRRWTWLIHKLGLIEVGKACGCYRRREWLNTFGGKLTTSEHWAAKLAARLLVRKENQ